MFTSWTTRVASVLLPAFAGSLGAQAIYKGELVRQELTTRTSRACPTLSIVSSGPQTMPVTARSLKLVDNFACESMEFSGPGGSLGEISWEVPTGPLMGTVASDNSRINLTEPAALAYKAAYRGTATLASSSSNPPRIHNVWVDITPAGFPTGVACPPAAVARSVNFVGGSMDLNASVSCQIRALQIVRVLSGAGPLTEFESRMTTNLVVDSGHVDTRCCQQRGGKVELTIHSTYKFVIDQIPLPPNPHQPRQPTDTRSVQKTGPGLKTACTPTSASPLKVILGFARAVGEVDSTGDLRDSLTLITKGVVTPWARLRLPVGTSGASNLRVKHTVLLNGVNVDYKGANTDRDVARGAYEVLVIDFPIWAVRFPARAAAGEIPKPRENEIQIRSVDPAGRTLCAEVDWAELSIGALAPVIMVHGNGQGDDGAGGRFWAGEILESVGRPRFPMNFAFVDALKDIPHDNSISMITAPTDDHATLLGASIPAIAGSWGARHAHLVAHSKGGLDSRAFMVQTIPANFGVLSITTLSTPHQGAVGPDYQIDSQGAYATYSDDTTRTKMGQLSPPNAGTASIRVSGAQEFNARNVPLLPTQYVVDGETDPVAYRSVSADMNLDDSVGLTGQPTIQHPETFALGQGDMFDTTFQNAVEQLYRLLGTVDHTFTATVENSVLGTIRVVKEVPATGAFRPNDAAVTRQSASVGPFVEIAHLDDNHSTIASPATGRLVLSEIRRIQPMRPNP